MNILNREQFAKHMSPEHNYLSGGEIREDVCEPKKEIVEDTKTGPILEVVEKKRVGERTTSNIPDFMRKTVAILANEPGVKQQDIADNFGMSQSVVSKAKNGISTQGHGKNEELAKVVEGKKLENEKKTEEIEDAALELTLAALKLTTPDDLNLLGAKDRIATAAQASKIVQNLKDKKEVNNDNRVQFVIMSPPVRQEVHYEELEV